MRLRFQFSIIPLIATVALVTLGILLGNWQTRRAVEKTALQMRLDQRSAAPPLVLGAAPQDAAALEFRRIVVTGQFKADWPVLLDNRPLDGRSGFIVLTPFTIAGSNRQVLVARGWLARDPAAPGRTPAPDTLAPPPGSVTIEGIAVVRPARVMQLGTPPAIKPGAVVQNLEVEDFARASGLDLQPFLLEQTGPALPGEMLVRKWPVPSVDVDRHKGYALQWYALAAMAFLFFVMTGCRRGRKQTG